jgi:hypothetical protein
MDTNRALAKNLVPHVTYGEYSSSCLRKTAEHDVVAILELN